MLYASISMMVAAVGNELVSVRSQLCCQWQRGASRSKFLDQLLELGRRRYVLNEVEVCLPSER